MLRTLWHLHQQDPGIDIDRAGPASVRVRAVPPLLSVAEVEGLIRGLVRDD